MRPSVKNTLGALVAAMASSGAIAQVEYQGLCDASAAVGLGRGHFVVADDESDVLRIYRRGTAQPVASVDLTAHLGNRAATGGTAEADIEGAARIGNRIYWISSHARKGKDASVDPHRQRFFATDIVGDTAAPSVKAVGAAYPFMLKALLADPRFAALAEASAFGPETERGLNIEGLAATGDGKLLIGFRNPRPGGKALVVPLLNPAPVVDSGAEPAFGQSMELDLGGRGIRSLERTGSEILIAAGPHGPADSHAARPPFALFRWSGDAAQPPTFVRALDDGSSRAEALFVDDDSQELVILSDDGDELVEGRECKHRKVAPERKRFRSRTLPHPPAPSALRRPPSGQGS